MSIIFTVLPAAALAGFLFAWRLERQDWEPDLDWRTYSRHCYSGARRLIVRRYRKHRHYRGPYRKLVIAAGILTCYILPLGSEIVVLGYLFWRVGRDDDWHQTGAMRWHLYNAGVFGAINDDRPPPHLPRPTLVHHDDHGTSVLVYLPGGIEPQTVIDARAGLASSIGVQPARLQIDVPPDASGDVVRLFVAAEAGAHVMEKSSRSDVLEPTDWAEPVKLGRTMRGDVIKLQTKAANCIAGGLPGFGKTTSARHVLAHFLLDASTTVHLLDGKGSGADYAPAEPLCETWILGGKSEDPVGETIEMFQAVHDEIVARNNADTPGREWPGILVLCEELQDVRAAAADESKAKAAQLDSLLGRVIRKGRAVSVMLFIATQRPSVEDLPSGVRNLVSQGICLYVKTQDDARMILGQVPKLPLPVKRPGAALVIGDGQLVAGQIDYMSAEEFSRVCAKAAELREAEAPVFEGLHAV